MTDFNVRKQMPALATSLSISDVFKILFRLPFVNCQSHVLCIRFLAIQHCSAYDLYVFSIQAYPRTMKCITNAHKGL